MIDNIASVIRKLYWDDKLSLQEIADRLNTYPQKVWRIMKSTNIPIRTRSQAFTLRYDKADKYSMDESFFDNWSPKTAWVLGLWFADGHIWKDETRAALTSSDLCLLQKVQSLMQSNFRIAKLQRSSQQIVVTRPHRVRKLMRYGLRPRKSASMPFPLVPLSCLSHFVRGFWDGDGWISIRKEGWLSVGASCASRVFMRTLKTSLETVVPDVYFIQRHRPYRKYDGRIWNIVHPVYSVRVHGERALKVCRWMYRDSTEATRLSRKYLIVKDRL